MQIKEFINKANHNDEIVVNRCDSLIRVYDNENDLLFRIPLDATNFLGIDWFTSANDFISKETSKYLSALIEEFLETPVKERFPGKKYRLVTMRYIEGPVAIKQYVTDLQASGDYMTFCFGSKENAVKWTDKELRNMSQWFPQKAIDAMKEPVEE